MVTAKERPLRIYQEGPSGKFFIVIKGKKKYMKFPAHIKTLKEAQKYAIKHYKAKVSAPVITAGRPTLKTQGRRASAKRVSYRGRAQRQGVDPLSLDVKSLMELQRKKLMEESDNNLKELKILEKFALSEVVADQKKILDEIKRRETTETDRKNSISTQTDSYDGELDNEDTKSTSSRPPSPLPKPRTMSPLKPSFAQTTLNIPSPRPPTPTRKDQPAIIPKDVDITERKSKYIPKDVERKTKPYMITRKDGKEINLLETRFDYNPKRESNPLDDLPTPTDEEIKDRTGYDPSEDLNMNYKKMYYSNLQREALRESRKAAREAEGSKFGSGTMFGNGEVDRDTGNPLPPLYSDEIDEYFANEPMYAGTIASDQIDELPLMLPMGFVMNLDKSNQPGSHWVGIYLDQSSVEYFDPLANKPPPHVIHDIKQLLKRLNAPTMMKMKINEIKQQHGNSYHCGYHAIRFLDDRFNGIPFPLTTRYGEGKSNVKQGEEVIKKEFSFI